MSETEVEKMSDHRDPDREQLDRIEKNQQEILSILRILMKTAE